MARHKIFSSRENLRPLGFVFFLDNCCRQKCNASLLRPLLFISKCFFACFNLLLKVAALLQYVDNEILYCRAFWYKRFAFGDNCVIRDMPIDAKSEPRNYK